MGSFKDDYPHIHGLLKTTDDGIGIGCQVGCGLLVILAVLGGLMSLFPGLKRSMEEPMSDAGFAAFEAVLICAIVGGYLLYRRLTSGPRNRDEPGGRKPRGHGPTRGGRGGRRTG